MTLIYAKTHYSSGSNDFYAAFVIRALEISEPSGVVGVISSRLGFYLEGLKEWRENLMCGGAALRLLADLGYGILDAVVETATYVLDKHVSDDSLTAILALSATGKLAVIEESLAKLQIGQPTKGLCLSSLEALRQLPGAVLAYWLPQAFLARLLHLPKVKDKNIEVLSGLQTDDDFRFLRLWWECPPQRMYDEWFPFAKGGEYQPYADDLHLTVKWAADGAEMKEFVASLYGNWSRHIKNVDRYFENGLTYTERTTSDLSIRAFPARAIFSVAGPVLQSTSLNEIYGVWGILTSRIGRVLIEMGVGSGDSSRSGTAARHYRTGIIKEIFWPTAVQISRSRGTGLKKIGAICGFRIGSGVEVGLSAVQIR